MNTFFQNYTVLIRDFHIIFLQDFFFVKKIFSHKLHNAKSFEGPFWGIYNFKNSNQKIVLNIQNILLPEN